MIQQPVARLVHSHAALAAAVPSRAHLVWLANQHQPVMTRRHALDRRLLIQMLQVVNIYNSSLEQTWLWGSNYNEYGFIAPSIVTNQASVHNKSDMKSCAPEIKQALNLKYPHKNYNWLNVLNLDCIPFTSGSTGGVLFEMADAAIAHLE